MTIFSDKPGMREQMIIALASPNLSTVEWRECAIDRIGALGAVQIGVEPPARSASEVAGSAPAAQPCVDRTQAIVPDAQAMVTDTQINAAQANVHRTHDFGACAPEAKPDAREPLDAERPGLFVQPPIVIEPRLSAMLLRLKYMGERSSADQAVLLLSRVLWAELRRRRDKNAGAPPELFARIAEQTIAEWVCGSCPVCRGTGRRGGSMGGIENGFVPCRACRRREDGQSTGMVTVKLPGLSKDAKRQEARISCPVCCGNRMVIDRKRVRARPGKRCARCGGDGHFLPSEAERALAIGVSLQTLKRRWGRIFDLSLRAVRALDRRLIEKLRKQLGRDINRVA